MATPVTEAVKQLLQDSYGKLREILQVEAQRVDKGVLDSYLGLLKQMAQVQTMLNQPPYTSKLNVELCGTILVLIANRKNSAIYREHKPESKLLEASSNIMLSIYQQFKGAIDSFQERLARTAEKAVSELSDGASASETINALQGLVRSVEDLRYTFDDIWGNDALKGSILMASVAPADEAKPILLYGPPGAGKNVLVEAYANFRKCSLVIFTAASIYSSLQGESEKNITKIIALSESAKSDNFIICVDEVDQIFKDRSSPNVSAVSAGSVINVALSVLDRYARFSDTLVFTTNYKSRIDPAILRRLTPVLVDYPFGEDAVNNYYDLLKRFNIADLDRFDEYRGEITRIFSEKQFLSTSTLIATIRKAFNDQYDVNARVRCGVDGLDRNRNQRSNACFLDENGDSTVRDIAQSKPGTPIYTRPLTMAELLVALEKAAPSLTANQYRDYLQG